MIIPANATTLDVVRTIADRNPGALSVLVQVMNRPDGAAVLKVLADDDIIGPALWTKYKDECNSNIDTLCTTLVPGGTLTREQALKNVPEEYLSAITEAYDDLDTIQALGAKDPKDLTPEDMLTIAKLVSKVADPDGQLSKPAEGPGYNL